LVSKTIIMYSIYNNNKFKLINHKIHKQTCILLQSTIVVDNTTAGI